MIIGLENQFSVFLRMAVLQVGIMNKFYIKVVYNPELTDNPNSNVCKNIEGINFAIFIVAAHLGST